jgi:methionine-rich copper-binding protein CopC
MKLHILFLFITISLATLSAQAHTVLSSSVPAENSVEATTPKNITLKFSTEVRLTGLSVEDGNGKPVDLGATPTTMQQEFAIPTSEISTGTYLVKWRAVGADMHIVSGEFQFVVAELISRK